MVSTSLFEKIKKQEKRLRSKKTFNKFYSSNAAIFLKYKQNFKLNKCNQTKCKCFKVVKIIFKKDNSLLYIQKTKKNILKLIDANERHFNAARLMLNQIGECVKRKVIKKGIAYHLETLKNFKSTFDYQNKEVKYLRFVTYVENEIGKCEEYLDEIVPWQYNEYIPGIIHLISLSAHYHTLKLFQSFILHENNQF